MGIKARILLGCILSLAIGESFATAQGWFDQMATAPGASMPSVTGFAWSQPPPPVMTGFSAVPAQPTMSFQPATPVQQTFYNPQPTEFSPQGAIGPVTASNRLFLDSSPRQSGALSVSAEIGTLVLARSGAAPQPIALDVNDVALLDASQLENGLQPGVQVKFGLLNLRPGCPIDLQFEAFGVNNIGSGSTINAEGGVISQFFGGVPVAPDESTNFSYLSDLANVELNLRYRWLPRVRLLAGFRFFQLEENYDIVDSTNIGPGTPSVGFFSFINNRMLGGQVGAETTFWQNDLFSLYGSAKYAFLNNVTDGQATAVNASGEDLQLNYEQDRSANLLDIEVGLFSVISNRLGLKGGYRGLFSDQVAIAPNQSASFDIFDGSGAVAYSNPEWHGFFLSLEGVF